MMSADSKRQRVADQSGSKPQIGSSVFSLGGDCEWESTWGVFLWCWARLEGHVAKHQISGPTGLGGVFLNKRYCEILFA